MSQEQEFKKLEKSSKFEERMAVVERDNPDLAKACRSVHSTLVIAQHVAESVFNDDVADQPEVVMQIAASIADELEEMKDRDEDDEDDDGEHA